MDIDPNDIIDALGGTLAVATICDIRPASVSGWRTAGIPQARRQFLELLRPDVFAEARAKAAERGASAESNERAA